jgi:hypothetical protein
MRSTPRTLLVLAGTIGMTAVALAQQSEVSPLGNWGSAGTATYTNPFLAGGAEFYLNIDVAQDGSFRGVWGQYFCTASIGAYGYTIFTCPSSGSRGQVSGRFGAGGQGVIDLEGLGQSAFLWTAPAADELAIDLPEHWQGTDAVLYRARLTRDGKVKPWARPAPPDAEGPLLSANALYREFVKDEYAALRRYVGKALVLEGRRGTLIPLSNGGAAIHVPDGFTSRALVLSFADLTQVSGIDEGARFRFECILASFDYQYVHMENCAIVRD